MKEALKVSAFLIEHISPGKLRAISIETALNLRYTCDDVKMIMEFSDRVYQSANSRLVLLLEAVRGSMIFL